MATRRGSSDTSAKKSQLSTYSAALGSVSEIVFNAIGMKPPGLASVAPAAKIATAGDDATLLICSMAAAMRAGLGGWRARFTTNATSTTASTTSMIATHVFGVDVSEAATSPITKAATTPINNVAVSAPK